MLALTNQFARVANFNPRAEKHGDDNVLAADIKLEVNASSHVLDLFDTSLRPLLFRKPEAGEQPALFTEGDGLTALRLPHLAPLKWDNDYTGWTLSIDSGLGISEPLVLTEVELSNFTFEATEGGTVKTTFRATCHPDADQSGLLCTLIGDDVELTLSPPVEATAQTDLASENESFADAAEAAINAHKKRAA